MEDFDINYAISNILKKRNKTKSGYCLICSLSLEECRKDGIEGNDNIDEQFFRRNDQI